LGVRCIRIVIAALCVLGSPATSATINKRCVLDVAGDACIFDVRTTSGGMLSVCTKTVHPGTRWRTTLGHTNATGGQTAVGNGSTTLCSGSVNITASPSQSQQVIITIERPRSTAGTHEAIVTFNGPMGNVPDPRPNGRREASIINGSFELGPDPAPEFFRLRVGDISIPGWPVVKGEVDIVSSPYWQAYHGPRNLDLNGAFAGSVAQSISGLRVGTRYQITFGLSGNPDCDVIKTLRVVIDNDVRHFNFDTSGGSHSNMKWTSRSFEFTYRGRNPTLKFESFEESFCGPVIDDVQLHVVPAETTRRPSRPTWPHH
jgi:choice-of-anchor C domain-containing protein